MKTGLVLEGGGMRGLFTAGILDVMMEEGIKVDGIIGVSAGATFGCNFKSHQPGRVLRYNMNFRNNWRYMSIRSLLLTGDLVGAEFSYHVLPTQLDIFDFETFRNDPTVYYVVTTDADTAEPCYHRIDNMTDGELDWMRASASMPMVSRPVPLDDGHRYLDGGIVDSIPLQKFQELGYERNIVILTQPKGFTKRATKLAPLFRAFCKYPAIVKAMCRRHEMYNAELAYLSAEEQKGNTLVIAPETTLPIGRTEMKPTKMQHVYNIGRQTALSLLPQIKAFLASSTSKE